MCLTLRWVTDWCGPRLLFACTRRCVLGCLTLRWVTDLGGPRRLFGRYLVHTPLCTRVLDVDTPLGTRVPDATLSLVIGH